MAYPESDAKQSFVERLTGPFAPEAYFAMAPCIALVIAGLFLDVWVLPCLGGFVGAFALWFFRNPKRGTGGDEYSVVAPADGRVVEIGKTSLPDGSEGCRIGIFLSIFNVHVNRVPVTGQVVDLARHGSGTMAAFRKDAHQNNVRLEMSLETAEGAIVRVVQISGWIARRIVCHPNVGQVVQRGVRYGLIRFGSRTDVVLPANYEVMVAIKERVWGGKSEIARLGKEVVK